MRRRVGVGLLDMKDEVFQDGLFSGMRKTATRNKFSSLRIIKIHERRYISEQYYITQGQKLLSYCSG